MPALPSTSITADSLERKALITSPTKSDEPGVSQKLMLAVVPAADFHTVFASVAYIEMCRSTSSGVLSPTVLPVPIFAAWEIAPETKSRCSRRVVLPV